MMLLRFAVENHRSIRERQELSFAASTLQDRPDCLIPCDAVKSRAVLPAAVIYGANASGKTNMVNALETMQWMVLWSHVKGGPSSGVPRQKFRLDPDWAERPSSFEIDFVLEGVRYHYGFEATDSAFAAEWLHESPRAHSRKLFERHKQQFEFGRNLKGQNQSIARLARPNSLFLSVAAQNGHELLTQIYEYFQDITFTGTHSKSHVAMPTPLEGERIDLESGDLDRRVIDFLSSVDAGICGFRRKLTLVSERSRQFLRDMIEEGHTLYVAPPGFGADTQKTEELELAHRGKDGDDVYFALDLESSGTLRMLAILGKVFRAIDEGAPVIVDELDLSLHTAASEAALRLFCTRQLNRSGAQILATTHDTNLMKSDILRRDQLWFAEKSKDGATEIYPLTDFRTRRDDNIELGYRQGRYGAVPSDDPVSLLLENQ